MLTKGTKREMWSSLYVFSSDTTPLDGNKKASPNRLAFV